MTIRDDYTILSGGVIEFLATIDTRKIFRIINLDTEERLYDVSSLKFGVTAISLNQIRLTKNKDLRISNRLRIEYDADDSTSSGVTSVNGYTGVVVLSKSDIGLSDVPNLNTSTTSNITDTSSKRFVTDVEKETWNSKANNDNFFVIVSSNITTVLDANVNKNFLFTGVSEEQIVNLGNATAYEVGVGFKIVSDNTEIISVVNSSGVEILRFEPYNIADFVLTDNSTTDGVWVKNVIRPDSSKMSILFDDFVSSSILGQTNWRTSVSGAGATVTLSIAQNGRMGVVFFNTGSTSTGNASLMKNQNNGEGSVIFGGNRTYILETSVYVQNLSTATERFVIRFGFIDQASITPQDGLYFEYDEGTTGNFWSIVSSNNSIRTTILTNVPVINAVWDKFRIETNRQGNSAKFFINDLFCGEITTNIPTGSSRNTDIGYRQTKTVGNNIRPMFLDYVEERCYINR